MSIVMYDLAGEDADRRFSPFCWRIRMALAHKQLACEFIPWRYHEKPLLAFAKWERVPVLVDGERTVVDSWEIAKYLDQRYPDRPTLFGGPAGLAGALFVKFWNERVMQPIVLRAVLMDIFRHVHETDKAYFRSDREKRFGKTLEEVCADPPGAIRELGEALAPVRETVRKQPFLGGAGPAFTDYMLFGSFQWARSISDKHLLASDDPVHAWRERMLDLFDGLGRKAVGYPV